jgi:uncharacterized membrane protein YbhN (UPF0104 family)
MRVFGDVSHVGAIGSGAAGECGSRALPGASLETAKTVRRWRRALELGISEQEIEQVALLAISTRLPHVDPDAGRRLIESLGSTLRALGSDRAFLRQTLTWATLNWLLDAVALWCSVRAFGHSLGPVGLVVAYGLANVDAALPFTPGGLGIVEGILVPTLVAFETTRGVAILGVLTWRLFSFWIPIPIGLACYAPLATHHDASHYQNTSRPGRTSN